MPLNYAGLGGLGMPEILVIAGVAVLLFGGKKFAEFGRGMGEAVREWKKAFKESDGLEHEVKK